MTTQRFYGSVGSVVSGDLYIKSPTHGVSGRGGIVHGVDGPILHGNGNSVTEQRTLEAVPTRIVACIASIVVTISDHLSCEVTADENVLPVVRTMIDRDTLRVAMAGSASIITPIAIKLTLPTLDSISVKGAADVRVHRLLQPAFRCTVSGAGTVVASGEVERLDGKLSGAGSIDVEGVVAQDAALDISGAGHLVATVRRAVAIELAGVGSVVVHGNPVQRRVSCSGMGSVRWV